jgi:hypothetical protein
MQEFLLKRIVEKLLEVSVLSKPVNLHFAQRVMDLAQNALEMQESLKKEPARKAAEKELKEKINE